MNQLITLAFLPLMLLCSVASAQIKLEQTPIAPYQLWVGFVSPEIQADGTIKASVDSKPTLKTIQPDLRFVLVLDEGYLLTDLEVEAKPSLDFADPVLVPLEGNRIEMKLPSGDYRAKARLDFGGKEVIRRFNFTIGAPNPLPEPVNPDNPIPNPTPTVPEDRFGNIGQRVSALAGNLPFKKEVAANYRQFAEQLKGSIDVVEISRAMVAKRDAIVASARTEWIPVMTLVLNDFNARRPEMVRADVVEHWLAIANGLDPK